MDVDFLYKKLLIRRDAGNLRQLPGQNDCIDFVSNDYLGLARSQELASIVRKREAQEVPNVGGTGSRLLSGNHIYYQEAESLLTAVFGGEVLIFNSGYHANQALVSSVAEKGDTIIYDQLAHVCIKEGAWLSKADSVAFRHNDLSDLENKLKQAKGRKFVVIESVYSMDGDIAPVEDIVNLCENHNGYLIVDEAHSTGVYGDRGSGLLTASGLAERVFARIYTFGKAMGVHGACVAGQKVLIDYLINFARPFIYTTSLPPVSLIAISESFRYLHSNLGLQGELREKINLFRSGFPGATSETAIQPILMGSNDRAREVSTRLHKEGFDVRPILSPTVQKGKERLRISLHSFHTVDQIKQLTSLLNHIF